MAIKRFLREKFTGFGIITGFIGFVSVFLGLEAVYTKYLTAPSISPVVWAGSVTVGLYLFVGLLNYCWFAQLTMQEEIDRQARIKERLESQVLRKRQSSRK